MTSMAATSSVLRICRREGHEGSAMALGRVLFFEAIPAACINRMSSALIMSRLPTSGRSQMRCCRTLPVLARL